MKYVPSMLAAAVVCGVFSGPAWADAFTQRFLFQSDMDFKSMRFSPDGSSDYYEACTESITQLPVSAGGATVVELDDNGFEQVSLGFNIEFFGEQYDEIGIGANGYVTMGFGDIESNGTAANHFSLPRVSAFFTDLKPDENSTISWRIIGTKVVVTYRNVPLAANPDAKATFQIELYSSGGVIISWLDLPDVLALSGISAGTGTPAGFQDSDLSAYAACASPCLTAVAEVADELEDIYTSSPLNFPADEMDLDVNGIPDVLNLRVLELMIRRGDAYGHCQVLAAWEQNLAIMQTKIAVLPNNFFTSVTREEFTRACAGMATLGDGRFAQKLVRLMGVTTSLNIGRDEMDDSGEPYASWSGDPDFDGVCNRGEFIASSSFSAFLAAAFDANITANGGECFDDIFEFPDGEQIEEGEGVPDPDAPLCVVTLSGSNMVPANNSPYFGRVEFTELQEQIAVTVTHNVPLPANVVVFRGKPGQQGVPFITLGSGTSPMLALISRAALDIISTGYYIQVTHQGSQSGVDVRGQIECNPVMEEGEDPVEGEGVVDGEGDIDGAIEGEGGGEPMEGEGGGEPVEGEGEGGIIFEGEPEPFTSCLADLSGNLSVPPFVTSFGGVLVLSNLGDEAQLLIFHNVPSPTFGAIHLGSPGEVGPKLLDIPSPLESPIIYNIPMETAQEFSRGVYVRLGYSGFSSGEIRGDLACSDAGGTEGQVDEGEDTDGFHSADYVGPDGIIEMTELLRVVQMFNLDLEFGCADEETGYAPGSLEQDCRPADFDYAPQNWRVDLAEVIRLIQFYNARGYISNQPTEDGFAPFYPTGD